MRDRIQMERERQKKPGTSNTTRIFNVVGNQSILQTMPEIIQREIEIPDYNEEQIRKNISDMQDILENIGKTCNCSGFVDSVLSLAFNSKYYCWNSLKATGALNGFGGAKDYDVLLFYSTQTPTVAKHISFKEGDNSVGRNQGNPVTKEVMFKKPIEAFIDEGFEIRYMSAYNLMKSCGKRAEPADNDPNGCGCRVQ